MSGFFGTTQAGSDNQFSPLFMQGATNTATASHNDSETNEEQRRERKRSNNRSTQRGSTGQTSTNKRNNSTKHEAGSRNVASAMDLTELAQIKPALRESDPTEAVETSPRLPAARHALPATDTPALQQQNPRSPSQAVPGARKIKAKQRQKHKAGSRKSSKAKPKPKPSVGQAEEAMALSEADMELAFPPARLDLQPHPLQLPPPASADDTQQPCQPAASASNAAQDKDGGCCDNDGGGGGSTIDTGKRKEQDQSASCGGDDAVGQDANDKQESQDTPATQASEDLVDNTPEASSSSHNTSLEPATPAPNASTDAKHVSPRTDDEAGGNPSKRSKGRAEANGQQQEGQGVISACDRLLLLAVRLNNLSLAVKSLQQVCLCVSVCV